MAIADASPCSGRQQWAEVRELCIWLSALIINHPSPISIIRPRNAVARYAGCGVNRILPRARGLALGYTLSPATRAAVSIEILLP
ncbi:MAG TPA: hypothetical protein VK651_07740 [Blastocatellia bacterium]|nr:hypothetical protein [Blastocatellia bacterium]